MQAVPSRAMTARGGAIWRGTSNGAPTCSTTGLGLSRNLLSLVVQVIRNVPPGNYGLRLWHERCSEQQLAAQRRVLSLEAAVTDLGVIRLDEAGYILKAHKNKHGEDYEDEQHLPAYRRP